MVTPDPGDRRNIIRQLVTKLESSELRVRAQVLVNPMAT